MYDTYAHTHTPQTLTGREKGVEEERGKRREVPQQLRHWRARRQAALEGQTQLLTAESTGCFVTE